ncbi:MAG: hypothetical protein LUE93_00670 [Bacteroides sp.]|nr:hypothetical protein [Bacteroides sp.]
MYYIDEYSIKSTLLSDLSVPVNNPVRALFIDRYRNLWIGTKGDGIVKLSHYDPFASSLPATSWYHTTNSVLKDNSVYTFLPSERNLLWIGSEEGLNYYSYRQEKIRTLMEPPGESPVRYVHALCEQGDSILWIATVGEGILKARLGGSRDEPEITEIKRFIVEEGRRGTNYFLPPIRRTTPSSGLGTGDTELFALIPIPTGTMCSVLTRMEPIRR